MKFQRDALIDVIYERSAIDDRIIFLSSDFGAPALDRFRRDRADNFLHLGISEQNMIDVAAGLALDGRVVFTYAMAPFVSLRCLEQHKCSSGIMDLPICTVVAGIGLGYADSGPTHYATEDFACLRALVNSSVYTCADSSTATAVASLLCEKARFSFVRLDRQASHDLAPCSIEDTENGYRILKTSQNNDGVCVISTGFISHRAVEAIEMVGDDRVTHIDLIRAKPFPDSLIEVLSAAQSIVTIDEQTPSGSLGSAVLEFLADSNIVKPLQRISLPERYFFENSGRAKLLDDFGLSIEAIAATLESHLSA
jgi:transketolase